MEAMQEPAAAPESIIPSQTEVWELFPGAATGNRMKISF
jgi:hypothetical protein